MKGLNKTFLELDKRLESGVAPSERRNILIDMALIVGIRKLANDTRAIKMTPEGIEAVPMPFITEE